MSGFMWVGVMFCFCDIIKLVVLVWLIYVLLCLYYYIIKGGEGYVVVNFLFQCFIVFYVGIEEFDQFQFQMVFMVQFLDLFGNIDVEYGYYVGFIVIGVDYYWYWMLVVGKEGFQYWLWQYCVFGNRCWFGIQWCGE